MVNPTYLHCLLRVDDPSTISLFLTMCVHFKNGGLTRDVTGNFRVDVLKRECTSINLGGSCNINVYLMDWEVVFLFL